MATIDLHDCELTDEETCWNCKFWESFGTLPSIADEDIPIYGRCKRRSPSVIGEAKPIKEMPQEHYCVYIIHPEYLDRKMHFGVWPYTCCDECCGEFVRRKE